MRQIEDALRHPNSSKEDIITVFLALQKQTFCVTNSMLNLLQKWPAPQAIQDPDIIDEVLSKFGISSETKD